MNEQCGSQAAGLTEQLRYAPRAVRPSSENVATVGGAAESLPPFAAVIDRLQRQVRRNDELVSELMRKLDPILGPALPSPDHPNGNLKESGMSSGLTAVIREMSGGVSATNNRIEEILRRCEL